MTDAAPQDRPVQDFGLLVEPTRRMIVALLAERPYRSTRLAEAIGVSPAALAHHLRLMREAGIVLDSRVVRDGRVRLYTLHPRRVRSILAWLAKYGLDAERSPGGTCDPDLNVRR